MGKTIKFGVMGLMMLALAACGTKTLTVNVDATIPTELTMDQFVGTWSGETAAFDELTLNADGTFTSMLEVDNEKKPWSAGKWSVEPDALILEDPDYIVNGRLTNVTLVNGNFSAFNEEQEADEIWKKIK